MLRQEVLDAQFAGMRNALQNATPEDLQRIRDMMCDLNDMLDADARGEHTDEQFDEFMQQYGEFFPENPQNLDELVDSLARRAAAAQRLLESLTPDQRNELVRADAAGARAGRPGRADGPAAAGPADGAAGPALGRPRQRMGGDEPLGYSDATAALADLADLDAARRPALAGLPRAPASTTSTRSSSSARSAGRPSTTSSNCGASSGSCGGRATWSAAAPA